VDARDRLRTVASSILDRRPSPTEESLALAGQPDNQQHIAPGAVVLQGFRALEHTLQLITGSSAVPRLRLYTLSSFSVAPTRCANMRGSTALRAVM
jgi:hypothetical protein